MACFNLLAMESVLKLYHLSVGAPRALEFSEDLMLGLEYFEETQGLIPTVKAAHDGLEDADTKAQAAVKPWRKAKRQRKLDEYRAERSLDRTSTRCREADGDRPDGPVRRTVFPDGLAAAKAPVGQAQVAQLDQVIDRLTHSNEPRVAPVAEACLADLRARRDALHASETAYQAARAAYRTAMDLVSLRQEEHRRVMDSIFGQLRALYPGDTRTQDLIAPSLDD